MPFELVADTWDNDIVPFHEALINVERYGLFDAQIELGRSINARWG